MMCYLVCLLQQIPQQAQVSHPELAPSAQLLQPAVFSSPVQNGSDLSTVTTAAQLDNKIPCQLPPQALSQSQVQSQIPVLQPSDSQRGSSGSASSCLTQQKQLSALTGAAGQGPTETNKEVWTHDSLPRILLLAAGFSLPTLLCKDTCSFVCGINVSQVMVRNTM